MRSATLGERAQKLEMHLDVANPLPLPREMQIPAAAHGVASGFFGHVPMSAQPIRRVAPDEAREIFLRGMLDRPMEQGHRNPLDWMVSLAVHIAVITAVIVVPMLFTQVLDIRNLQVTHLAIPRPPAAAPAPAPPMIHKAARPVHSFSVSKLVAPTVIPKQTFVAKGEEQAPDIDGVVGGIPGGAAGGALGGILGGTASGPAAPAAPVSRAAAKATVLRVGGDVKPPKQIFRSEPQYPLLARTAKVEGVVVIDATIDEHGNIVQAHAISGPGLLIPSALEAVLQWKYEPTYLNGEAVPIAMNVQVFYRLRG